MKNMMRKETCAQSNRVSSGRAQESGSARGGGGGGRGGGGGGGGGHNGGVVGIAQRQRELRTSARESSRTERQQGHGSNHRKVRELVQILQRLDPCNHCVEPEQRVRQPGEVGRPVEAHVALRLPEPRVGIDELCQNHPRRSAHVTPARKLGRCWGWGRANAPIAWLSNTRDHISVQIDTVKSA
eukprot:COSAG04_NODE_720_length_10812_cov_2.903108_9_plen_184_part_00